jgi:hypothetical protein
MKKAFTLLRFSSLLFLILLVSSCNKDDDPGIDDNFEGSFEVTISGEESFTLTGLASYNEVVVDGGTPDSRGSFLTMVCSHEENDDMLTVYMVKLQPNGFGDGTYSFVEDPEDDQIALSVTFYSSATQTTYIITSGTVNFSDITEQKLEGTLNVELTNFSGGTITISGEFKARGVALGFGA